MASRRPPKQWRFPMEAGPDVLIEESDAPFPTDVNEAFDQRGQWHRIRFAIRFPDIADADILRRTLLDLYRHAFHFPPRVPVDQLRPEDWVGLVRELTSYAQGGGLHAGPAPQKKLPKLDKSTLPAIPKSQGVVPAKEDDAVSFPVELVDELGQPLAEVALLFTHGGKLEKKTTDGSGAVTHHSTGSSFASVAPVARTSLVSLLKERWSQPRPADKGPETWVTETAGTLIRRLDGRDWDLIPLTDKEKVRVSYQPAVPVTRLVGLHFDTNRSFLLPTALPYLKELPRLYQRFPQANVLVVGHTDTTGEASVNDPLSLARAKALAAFLQDDVDAWLAHYEDSEPQATRWGKGEDKLMLKALADYGDKPKTEDPVRWFQRTRGLKVDGEAGPKTRRQLITEYMSLDGTTLPKGTPVTCHGCGSHFPVDQLPEAHQPAWDRESEQEHRRVEVFFFPKELGIVPPPPSENSAAGSLEYPAWLATAAERVDLTGKGVAKEVTLLEFHDALLRTDSCVLMPEGEDPDSSGKHQALTSVGLVASVLRFNEEHPGKRLLVAGHTDTAGSEGHNQQLSRERAEVVHCLLVGGDAARKRFGQLAEQRSTIHDYQQILSWLTAASPLTPDDGNGEPDEKGAVVFDCAPPAIDGKEFSSIQAVEAFQEQYNAQREALGAGSQPKLTVDGDVGPKTWSALFDCYEFALRCELGEDEAGVAALRKGLVWADEQRHFLGFGEAAPVDNLGRDGYRSQANRRVEVLFFDDGEVPDLAKAEEAPELCRLYLPGRFVREHVPPYFAELKSLHVPFYRDLDRDPLQNVRLSLVPVVGGETLSLEAPHPDVRDDDSKRLRWFHFREVPPGRYDLHGRVSGRDFCMARDLQFGRAGIAVGRHILARAEFVPEADEPAVALRSDATEFDEGEMAT